MKKLVILFAALCVLSTSFASFSLPVPPKKATEIFLPLDSSGNKISLMQLSEMNINEFEALSHRNLNLFDRMAFKLAQRDLKRSINADGTINSKKLSKAASKFSGETGFHFGGFALGFFVGLVGVLIAYLINDDYKRNRVKWAWIGLGAFLVIYLAIVLAMMA